MHTQRLTLTLTALASAGLLLTACGTESGAGSDSGSGSGSEGRSVESEVPLTGIRWNVDSVTVGGKKYEAPDDAHLKIGKDGRAGGSFGCNYAGVAVKIKGDTLDFGKATMTKRACPEGLMTFEENLTRALAGEKLTATADGDRLTLTTAGGDRVDLTSGPGKPGTPLTGTKWTVHTVGDGKSAAPLPKDVSGKAHLTFGKDGKARGNLGCNDVTAKAEAKAAGKAGAKEGRITFGAPTTTRKMCPGDTMATERKLLKLFDGTARYDVERDTLKLTAADGTVIDARAATP
ncbi:META domain-containing protein [Streptomyces sp. NRRL S-920]|uniref:META domain-containing protein n=1 Tax=Streptomyces sp. NRRL S-920 TaxID=1463921 RepID=UPI0004C84701|nr:META domain-containing protein [Streptomyces sp. NRRL S-920]